MTYSIDHDGFTATVGTFGPDPEFPDEYIIDLSHDELGNGVLMAWSREGIRTSFEGFIDDAMADMADAHLEQYGEYSDEDYYGEAG